MRVGDYVVQVWPRRQRRPNARHTLRYQIQLSRELMAPGDGALSRSGNAPCLTKDEHVVELSVPTASANSVLVFEGLTFDSFEGGLRSLGIRFSLAPTELALAARFVSGQAGSLALTRIASGSRAGPTHCLLHLPQARWVEPGASTLLYASSLLVIGDVAVDVFFGSAAQPSTTSRVEEHCVFRLSELDVNAAHLTALLALQRSESTIGKLLIPNHDGPVEAKVLSILAAKLLRSSSRGYLFVPVWEDQTRPRLAFLYRAGEVFGAVLSGENLSEWLDALALALRQASPLASNIESFGAKRVGGEPASPECTPTVTARRTTTLPPAARLGSAMPPPKGQTEE